MNKNTVIIAFVVLLVLSVAWNVLLTKSMLSIWDTTDYVMEHCPSQYEHILNLKYECYEH
jgi:hypothetical protein